MVDEFLDDGKGRMDGAINSLAGDLATFQTGRATPSLLDRLEIEAYGDTLNIKQMAVVSVPEPQQLAIRPFDANTITAIEKAIQRSDLGLTPNSDGKLIRLNIPALTEERRRLLSKQINKRTEEAKVAIRNIRRDVLGDFRDLKTEKMISEDDFFQAQDSLQELTDAYVAKVDVMAKDKGKEVMKL